LAPEDKGLGADGLMLLIRSYENMVKPLTEILQLSGQIVMSQKESAECSRDIISQHKAIIRDIETIVSNLSTCSEKMGNVATTMESSFTQNRNSCSSEHASLKNKIHLGWISSGVVVIALISLVIKVFATLNNLEHLRLLVPISKVLGVEIS